MTHELNFVQGDRIEITPFGFYYINPLHQIFKFKLIYFDMAEKKESVASIRIHSNQQTSNEMLW
jgi:hypothetical protein